MAYSDMPEGFYANADEDIRQSAWAVNEALVAAHRAGVPEVTVSDAAQLGMLVEYAHAARTELAWLRERMEDRLEYYEEEKDSANYRSHALPSAQMASFLRKLLSKDEY